jgi:hypothetical protein
MASLVISGDTSGSITVSAPAVAGSNTQTLVATTGTLAPIVSGTALTAVTNFTTSADFTSIPSWVKRITVMLQGVSLSGTDDILIQIGDSGGLETTGYIASSTGFTGSAGSTVSNTTGFILSAATAAYIVSGCVVLTNLTGNVWIASGAGKLSTAASWVCGGDKTLSATLDRVSITRTGTNTFDAGTINILYE